MQPEPLSGFFRSIFRRNKSPPSKQDEPPIFSKGRTALDIAAASGDVAMVKLLVEDMRINLASCGAQGIAVAEIHRNFDIAVYLRQRTPVASQIAAGLVPDQKLPQRAPGR